MKRYVVYDNFEMAMSADKFFVGLAGMVGDRFKFEPAIAVDVSDEELAGMIERILAAAGVKYYEIPLMRVVAFGPETGDNAVHVEGATPKSIDEIVGESMESQAKEKRGKKHAIVASNGKAVTDIEANEPVYFQADTAVGLCKICGQPAKSKRAKVCGSADCEKKYKAQYMKDYWKRHGKPTASAAEPGPSEAELQEVAEFEQTLAEELASEGLPADGMVHISQIDGLPEPGLNEPRYGEEPALPVEEADHSSWSWLVEDGPRKGSRMTNKQIVRLLMQGNLRVGQHIRHDKLGQCEVVKGKPPAQKLKQLYGRGAPRYILPAEIAA